MNEMFLVSILFGFSQIKEGNDRTENEKIDMR